MINFLARPLDDFDLRVIFIDGKVFKEHTLLIALGVEMSEYFGHVVTLRVTKPLERELQRQRSGAPESGADHFQRQLFSSRVCSLPFPSNVLVRQPTESR